MGRRNGQDGGTTIVLKREEAAGHGHHGGAWKVAYADFVTAMMAFFLLMWLLNATSEEQRRGLADYFAPSNVFGRNTSGTGQPFGGRTLNSEGEMSSDAGAIRVERGPVPVRLDIEEEEGEAPLTPNTPLAGAPPAETVARAEEPEARDAGTEEDRAQLAAAGGAASDPAAAGAARPASATPADEPQAAAAMAAVAQAAQRPEPQPTEAAPGSPDADPASTATLPALAPPAAERLADAALRAELHRRERAAFERAAAELRAAVRDDPDLADLARQLVVEQVPEGLRIQILDADRQPMFATGGAVPNDRARLLIQKVAQVVARLPNALAIAGHTDASPFRGGGAERGNWELSADRANAARRLLLDGGIAEARLQSVTGHADRTPLLPAEPLAAANRRVAITLLRQAPAPDAGP
ncbi:flagellar motor protein MotB, partial [Craurococcus roseus]|uniref:flagellar motor protein MotB n=1 Tax=Craurococcus roseus TaxID=77585 RepID=UPI0031CE6095